MLTGARLEWDKVTDFSGDLVAITTEDRPHEFDYLSAGIPRGDFEEECRRVNRYAQQSRLFFRRHRGLDRLYRLGHDDAEAVFEESVEGSVLEIVAGESRYKRLGDVQGLNSDGLFIRQTDADNP
jgi:hypothetical protein